MPSLSFAIEKAEAIPFAAAPTIGFTLRVLNALQQQEVQSVALRCQIMIEAMKRHYTEAERGELRDLFGEPDRWNQTLRSLLWTHAAAAIPNFTGSITVDLPVPCTFDFNVAAAKYFHASREEDIPLVFQFSGTVFYAGADGALQIGQIGWDQEARFRLPALVWHEMMDLYYPNSAWLRLSRDVFQRLQEYKRSQGQATWEQAIESLLSRREGATR